MRICRPEKPVDLVAVIRQVADGLQTLARDRGVDGQVPLPLAPQVVPGERDELLRLFENLMENALRYGASDKGSRWCSTPTRRQRNSRGAYRRARLGAGHRARASAAFDRALLSRRCRRKPCPGWHRPWVGAGQAHSQPPRRPADDRKHARAGSHIYRAFAGGVRRHRRNGRNHRTRSAHRSAM